MTVNQVTMLELTRALSQRLSRALDDPTATSVNLERDEAVLCLGLLNGLAEVLEAEGKERA